MKHIDFKYQVSNDRIGPQVKNSLGTIEVAAVDSFEELQAIIEGEDLVQQMISLPPSLQSTELLPFIKYSKQKSIDKIVVNAKYGAHTNNTTIEYDRVSRSYTVLEEDSGGDTTVYSQKGLLIKPSRFTLPDYGQFYENQMLPFAKISLDNVLKLLDLGIKEFERQEKLD